MPAVQNQIPTQMATASTIKSIRVSAAAPGSVPDNVHDVISATHFQSIMSADLQRVAILFFWAAWAEPCAPMGNVVRDLARKFSQVVVLQVRLRFSTDCTAFGAYNDFADMLIRGYLLD